MIKRAVIYITVLFIMVMKYPFSVEAHEYKNFCYILSYDCPQSYYEYARNNLSNFIMSDEYAKEFTDIYIGTPFSFSDLNAGVYYFPVICDGSLKFLFRVYPDGDSFSAVLSEGLVEELSALASNTSTDTPMELHFLDRKIFAVINDEDYEIYTYPLYCENSTSELIDRQLFSVINIYDDSGIVINLSNNRDFSKYLSLSINETQGYNNHWCTAYCLASIIRTRKNISVSANDLMTIVYGANPSQSLSFPWINPSGYDVAHVSMLYNMYPMVLYTTASDTTLINEIDANRPCIVGMTSVSINHAVVLRGYSTTGIWSIWNPWYSYYENYSMGGSYLPAGYPVSYTLTPLKHAYYFN